MKKALSLVVAVALVAALAVSMSAASIDNLPASKEIEIAKVAAAPKLDGMPDAAYGNPVWDFSGQDAWNVDALGGAEADYAWNLWPDGYEATESAEPAKNTHFTGWAVWDDANLYLCIKVSLGGNTFYYNPTPDWQGNGIQIAMCPEESWVDENSQVEWGYSLADATTPSMITYRTGIFGYDAADVTSRVVHDGSDTAYYEFAFEFSKFEVTAAAGLKMLFCVSVNVNIADDLSTDDFNGYQIGQGVYNGKGSMADSHCFVLADAAAAAPVEEAPVEEAPVEEAPVEEAPVEEKPVVAPKPAKPAQTADVSAIMYVLATISTIGGAIVLKRK